MGMLPGFVGVRVFVMLDGKYDPKTIDPWAQDLWERQGTHRFDPERARKDGVSHFSSTVSVVARSRAASQSWEHPNLTAEGPIANHGVRTT